MLALCVQDKARLDISRLQRLSSGFGNFTTSGIRSTVPDTNAPALDDTSKEVLKIVFNSNGSYLQVRVHHLIVLPSNKLQLSIFANPNWAHPQECCFVSILMDVVQLAAMSAMHGHGQ